MTFNTHFNNVNEAMVAVHKLTPMQKERMLLDLVWKCYEKPDKLTYKQVVSISYNTAILVP